MIVVTLKNLVEAFPILKEIGDYEFNARTAFRIARVIRACENELKGFENTRQLILKKYGKVNQDQKNFVIEKENIDDFNSDMQALLDTRIELVADPINIEELEDINFTPAKLAQLGNLIIE